MRPLPRPVGTALRALGPLVAAIPRAWAIDRLFRYALIGAAVALATLLARPLVDRSDRVPASPPTPGVEIAAPDAFLPPPGARYEDPKGSLAADATPAETPPGPLTPGRTLDGLRIETDPDTPADPFGTLRAADPAPRPKETP